MRIPGWWRVRHFYIDTRDSLRVIPKYFQNLYGQYLLRKARNKKVKKGINVIGFAKGDFGLAEHMRLVTHGIATTEIKFCVNNSGDSGDHSANNRELEKYMIEDNPYRINLFCYNSNFIIQYMQSFKGEIAVSKHYNIAYSYWELSKYPKEWNEQNKYLQEIWAPSAFIKEVIEKDTDLPVIHMTIPVDFKMPVGYTRTGFNLPEDSFLFLFTFDFSSFITRKNPEAVIQAFTMAFPVEKRDKVSLVIKINRIKSKEEHTLQVQELIAKVAYDNRILIIDEILDRSSILGLINECDCYVSLHRAEGFGLGMAEAMKMGKVVIATDYSGNRDFMNSENSCPVKYKLIEIKKEEYSHVEDGALWAEPDVEHAGYFMKKVYEDPAFTSKIGKAARAYIDTYHNFKTIGEAYQRRINEILQNRPN
jgi:glycosyltransferase involved in cell wall biosynthesis